MEILRSIRKVQCGGCGKYFGGNSLFEQHRTGSVLDGKRRCMTDEEMIARGLAWEWCMVKMIIENKQLRERQAVWYDPVARDELRAAFHKDESMEEADE